MKKKIMRISVIVLLGMLVMAVYGPTPKARGWGGMSGTGSTWIGIDTDNDSDEDFLAVWHDGWGEGTPPEKELFRIQEDGKVGIGTQDPTNKLDVNGSIRVRELPQDDTLNEIVVADGNGVLHIRDVNTIGGDDDWYDVTTGIPSTDINVDIYTNGDVGIGTTPTEELDVNGHIRVRELPQDDTLDDVVVADANGVLHKRDVNTIGGFTFNIITVTDDYTPDSSDYTILVDASSNHVTIELPPASDVFSQILVIKRIDDEKRNEVTIDADGSETIDGDLTVMLNVKFMSYTIQSDGSNWYIIASYGFMGRSHINNGNR